MQFGPPTVAMVHLQAARAWLQRVPCLTCLANFGQLESADLPWFVAPHSSLVSLRSSNMAMNISAFMMT